MVKKLFYENRSGGIILRLVARGQILSSPLLVLLRMYNGKSNFLKEHADGEGPSLSEDKYKTRRRDGRDIQGFENGLLLTKNKTEQEKMIKLELNKIFRLLEK